MKRRLVHPLWVHLPAIAALVFIIVFTIVKMPLPASAPVHFNMDGIPNDYGSPWVVFGLVTGLSVLFILISAVIDEVWARNERKESFNWFSLLDELVVGFLAGTYTGWVVFLGKAGVAYSFSWAYFVLFGGVTLLLGLAAEGFRPFRPHLPAGFADTSLLEQTIAAQVQGTGAFIFWQSQNPLWASLLATVLPVILAGAGVFLWFQSLWAGVILFIVAVLLVLPYGGLRMAVTREKVTIRFGLIGPRVLNLAAADIAAVALTEFSPMHDYGGYGIRRNATTFAYYLRGSRGVTVTTQHNKQYLIGSDHPEELYAVLQAVIESGRVVATPPAIPETPDTPSGEPQN